MSQEEAQDFELPGQGYVFWPVGTGDSTTITVNSDVVMQVDLHHLASSEEEDDPHTPIVDRLVDLLPTVDGDPYLSVFILTHPDEDHCRGFADLLDRVTIGEIWFTPRIFREYKKDLCDDAVAFKEEADRRVQVTISQGTNVGVGASVVAVGVEVAVSVGMSASPPVQAASAGSSPIRAMPSQARHQGTNPSNREFGTSISCAPKYRQDLCPVAPGP